MVRMGTAETDDRCWVMIEGQLDPRTGERLREHVMALGAQGCRRLLVDLARTTSIDSCGLSVLVGAMEEMERLGGELVVRPPPTNVYELGRLSRLGELLALVDEAIEEAEAIRRLSRLIASHEPQGPSWPQTRAFLEPGGAEEAEGWTPADRSSGEPGGGGVPA